MTMEQAPRAAAGDGTGARREVAGRLAGPGRTRVAVLPSHHGHHLEHWPLRDAVILRATEGAVPSARAHLRRLLSEWGQAELGPDAAVVVSELVTNAVAASAGLRLAVGVLIWLGSDSHCVLAAVADASPGPPVRLNLEPDAEGGRGLTLVEALSSRWGWHPASSTGLVKKVVWAEWRLPSGAGQRPATGLPNHCHAA